MNYCKNIIFMIFLICILLLLFQKSYKFIGGTTNTTDTQVYNIQSKLDDMIKNGNLTDIQKLKILNDNKIKFENILTNNNKIYTKLLTDLSSKDEDIDIAESNLEKSKNELLLATINVDLKEIIIKKKNNKNKKIEELLDFYIELNLVKQYNIYSIILISNIEKLRHANNTTSGIEIFKKELGKTLEFVKISYNKTNDLYNIAISSNNADITSYKSDLSNSKILSKQIRDNIILIYENVNTRNKLEDDIKNKLSTKNNSDIDEITKKSDLSFFDRLSEIFSGF